MTYILRSPGSNSEIKISDATFSAIQFAKTQYGKIIRIEENFDAVMEDFVELEETLLSFSLRYLAFGSMDHVAFQEMRNVTGRRMLHMLSAARLYRDALSRHAAALLKDAGQSTTSKSAWSIRLRSRCPIGLWKHFGIFRSTRNCQFRQ